MSLRIRTDCTVSPLGVLVKRMRMVQVPVWWFLYQVSVVTGSPALMDSMWAPLLERRVLASVMERVLVSRRRSHAAGGEG